ncbi:MAG: PIN domain-containing protein [Candidatus Sumerlaeia bacterium]
MIALDTNIIIRFLVRDDENQARLVYQHLAKAEKERRRFFISSLVVLETIWVLQSAYGLSRAEVLEALDDMRHMAVFAFEDEEVLVRLLNEALESRCDLADLLIALVAESAACESCLTLDKKAARLPFFKLME